MSFNDLPEIQIKRHIRATRLRLRVEPNQIRLTAPILCSQKQIQNFIDQSTPWLIETWQKYQVQLQASNQDKTLPSALTLFNIPQAIQIIYQQQKLSFEWHEHSNTLYISDRHPEQYLKAFIMAYAKTHLPIFLEKVSHEINLCYGKCSVRQAKTRWGSCSMRHDIMLNCALVFLDQKLVKYVCIHELAHTKYFDHSVKFWAEVQKYDQDYQDNRKALKRSVMPWWWF